MGWLELCAFLGIVFIGSYVQAVTGFAMGMIIVAMVGGLRLMDVPTLAAVASLLTIFNVALALRGQTQHVQRDMFKWLALGQVPAIFVGVQLMLWLDGNTRWLLEFCLGLFITIGGLSMWLKPAPMEAGCRSFADLYYGCCWRGCGRYVFRQRTCARLVWLQSTAAACRHTCNLINLFCSDNKYAHSSSGCPGRPDARDSHHGLDRFASGDCWDVDGA